MRPVAMLNLAGIMAQTAAGEIDSERAQKATENIVDLIGDPIAFSPVAQALAEVIMLSYDKENAVNIMPIRLDDTTGKILHDLGIAELENKPVKVEMTKSEFGPIKTTLEPGYYISKHMAVGLRGTMPTIVSALGGATLAGNTIEIMAKLVEEQDERVREDLVRQMRKGLAMVPSTNVSVQRTESQQTRKIIGNIVRYGEGKGTREEVPLTPEGVRKAALQAGESSGDQDAMRKQVYFNVAADKTKVPERALRAISVMDGIISREESDAMSRDDLIEIVKNSKQSHVVLREEGQSLLDNLDLDRHQTRIKVSTDRVRKGLGDSFDLSISRAALANQGVAVDDMTNEQVRETLRSR
jgi:hypothetical protein